MSSPRSSKNSQKRRSADGVWRTRTYGYAHSRGSEERLAVRLRRARLVSLGVGALVGLAAAGGIAYASYMPRFQIADINITGELALTEQMLRAAVESGLHDGRWRAISANNILLFSRNRLEEDLVGRFPRIRSVEASIASFETPTIVVKIEERTPYARWCHETACYLLDEQGLVFAPYADDVVTIPTIFRGGMFAKDPIGKRFLLTYFPIVKVAVESLARMDLAAEAVTIMNDSEYHIVLGNGTRIFFRFADDPVAIAENLKASLASEALAGKLNAIDYIDMRFDGRAYFKPK